MNNVIVLYPDPSDNHMERMLAIVDKLRADNARLRETIALGKEQT